MKSCLVLFCILLIGCTWHQHRPVKHHADSKKSLHKTEQIKKKIHQEYESIYEKLATPIPR